METGNMPQLNDSKRIVLAGDIGGTKTLLYLLQWQHGQFDILVRQRYDSKAFGRFQNVLDEFRQLHDISAVDAACFAVAGPVHAGRAQITYLPWLLQEQDLQNQSGIGTVRLINDFQAIGYGIDELDSTDLHCLQEGETVSRGVRAILGAGTSLGEGILVWQDGHYRPLPSEGGHTDFAPTTPQQLAMLDYLLKHRPRVSYGDMLSGAGLISIYAYLVFRDSKTATAAMQDARWNQDAAAVISEYALQAQDALAVEALQMFAEIYGAQAGNLALTTLATGGVYIAGGIAPKILPYLQQPRFMAAFHAKSPMTELMTRIPVYAVLNPDVGVFGAARVAMRACEQVSSATG
jgi:glucokinase